MSSSSQLLSLAVGLVTGNLFGIYIAQTYEIPDLHTFFEDLFSKAKKMEKDTRKDGNGDGKDR